MRELVRRAALRPVVADVSLGVGVAVGLLAAAFAEVGPPAVAVSPRPPDAGPVVLVAMVAAAVAVRRRYPIAALIALNAVLLVWFLAAYPGRLIALAPLIGCYTLAASRGWRLGLAGAVPTALIEIIAIRVVGDVEVAGEVPIVVLLVATAASAGTAVGYYRAVLAATRAQLDRETETREERARLLAIEERLRIARELHDVLGHTMATISVQAGVGLHVIDQRPAQARESLTAIKKICDEGLTDVKTILGILRANGPEQPRAPRGGVGRLSELIDSAETAGVQVELTVDGEPGPLPAPVDLAAFRIVQEALTNVLRHAEAHTVRLSLKHERSRLLITIRDDGRSASGGRCGHGIDGMRERALALSGQLTAAPHPDGGFEVRAELPLPNPR